MPESSPSRELRVTGILRGLDWAVDGDHGSRRFDHPDLPIASMPEGDSQCVGLGTRAAETFSPDDRHRKGSVDELND
jgi:hypothetical protein